MFTTFGKNILFRKLFTRFQACVFSSSSSSSPSPSRNAKVFAWWDVDSCGVPSGFSFSKVAPSIIAAVRANGIMGDVKIRAYVDFFSSEVDSVAIDTFFETGIFPCPVFGVAAEKDRAYKRLLMDLEDWVPRNPPPAHLFFIFGDVCFTGILHQLRMRNYNILLACPGGAHVALCHVATIMWQWSSMLKGEDLIGKHFNYPPDDPFNSWYGNSNVPLENPFSAVEQPTSSQNAKIYKPSSDIKLSEASKSISRQVIKILCSHPNGISIGDLRAKLTRCDLPLSKHFYGYKRFSNILVSIPHVQLQYLGEDNFWVRLVPSTTSAIKNKQEDGTTTQKLHNDVSHPPQPHWDTIRVLVRWDFDSCPVPSGISYLNVAPSIMGVLRANKINGPIHIDAYGDVSQLSEINQEALFLSGIDLHHIPGGKHNSHKWLKDWVSHNPPPAHLFLISGDKEDFFCGRVHSLSMKYNILLAWPRRGHFYIHNNATIVWQWSSMLKGKYFTGKYYADPPLWYIKVPLVFPPEWYRNPKVPRENPFLAVEEPTSSQNAEIHEPSSYIKLVEVPKSLSRQVRRILSSYPNGISIGDLRLHFRLIYMRSLHRGFYKHEEFCNILASMPHVQLLYIGEDNFCVRLSEQGAFKKKQRVVKNEMRAINFSGMPVLFSSGSFWDDMESFLFTSKGLRIFSQSRSREDLAHKLQKNGPPFLMSLTRNEILQLVELLIAEKKWLEESPSQEFPFRRAPSVQKSSSMGQSHEANDLIGVGSQKISA